MHLFVRFFSLAAAAVVIVDSPLTSRSEFSDPSVIGKILGREKLFWEFFQLFLKFLDKWPTDLPRSFRSAVTPVIEELASIFYYCHTKEETPSRESLTRAIEFHPSHFQERVKLSSPTFEEHLEKSFNLAMEELRITENTRELTAEELPKKKQTGATSGRKRKPQPDVEIRRVIVRLVEKTHPNSKGTNLDVLTCEELDSHGIDVLDEWRLQYKVKSWVEGYRNPSVKGRIQKMFSEDRKKG